MPNPPWTDRAADDKSTLVQMVARAREAIAKSKKLLKKPGPDTFLGRQDRGTKAPSAQKAEST